MKSRLGIALALGAAIGSAAILAGVNANAQDATSAPATTAPPSAAPNAQAPAAAPPARGGRQWRFSAEDRAAFFDARLAAIKAGLELTPDQQKLWDPVESAVRNMVTQMRSARQAAETQSRPADPVDALSRAAGAATTRGAALQKLADAARPLYDSLTPDQKSRLPILMRGMGRRMGMGMRDRRMAMAMMRRFRQDNGGSQRPDGRDNQDGRDSGRGGGMNDSQRM